MTSASLDMLEQSLVKKIEIMHKIEQENERQRELLQNPDNVDMQIYNEILDVKGELIDQLLKLDDGFQTLFDKVKAEVGRNKDLYKDQIKRMQQYIQEITGMSASIEATEHRNKKLAEEFFSAERSRMNYGKQASAAAFNYYKTMNNFQNIPPQFLDNKN